MSASNSERSPNGEAIHVAGNAPPLANYPHARKVGPWVFVSGCSSRRPDGTHRGVTRGADGVVRDVREQTAGVLANLGAVLEAAGASLANVVDITTFLVNMEDYAGYNEVYDRTFDRERGPARTTVAVKELPHPDLLIEIKATAYVAPPPRS